MDKTTVIHVKNERQHIVHRLARKMPELNAAYGLWILSFRRHGISPPRNKIMPRYFEFYGLAHLIEGTGWYWTPAGKCKPLTKGYGILSAPGTIHDYSSNNNDYIEDSICFTGPVADQLYNSGIITGGIMKIGATRRLLPIFELAEDPSHDSQLKANFALQKLLIDCYFEAKAITLDDDYPQFTTLIEQIQQEPGKWWNTTEMAQRCNLSENQFRVIFKRRTGMSPKQYIDQVKMKHASEQLCSSSQTIAGIAILLGYRDPYHFSRRFKSVIGMAPEHYRQHYAIQ
ncbi:MAG: helix-turn-helix domain-containing protein [Victivallaceae bacterium]|nr:helix-turn-helix domain-containing protein [Victivallaceae bacterium]